MKKRTANAQHIFTVELGAHSIVPPARAIRQLPRHWKLADPDAHLIAARSLVWLAVKTLAGAWLVIVLYAAVAS